MVKRRAGWPIRRRSQAAADQWSVEVPHRKVTFIPDRVEQFDDGSELVERLRTCRRTKDELDKPIYTLYQLAAQQAHPQVPRSVQMRYLSTDEIEPVELKPNGIKSRLAKYDRGITGILRGDFAPKPDDRMCPRCPNYFVCPVAER